MPKKILALQGKADSGKTETIVLVLEELLTIATGVSEIKRGNKRKGNLKPEVLYAILKIHGVSVGISSQGDHGNHIRRYVTLLVDRGCKVVVCATRSRSSSSSVTALKEIAGEAKPRLTIEWVEKSSDDENQAARNQESCDQLVSKVLEEVGKRR